MQHLHHLRFRQVHLDFHTSPHIDGIGAAFDKKHWQKTLKKACVDSITTFATCHHGWSYYDGKVGKKHPHLTFDLLREQFMASKEINVNVPIYLTAGVNSMMAYEHPEWQFVSDENKLTWRPNMLTAGFAHMCFNTPYLGFLCEQIREVVTLFPDCDGIFLDIIDQPPCCCRWCIDDMLAQGYDPEKLDERKKFAATVLLNYYKKTTEAAKHRDPKMPIFHNSGHIQRGQTKILDHFSHLELESLPTGGWGYDHFPMSAKYAQKLPHDFLGMTGKFHTTWGEFGGFKHPNALRYECAAMLAFGSKCSVGDQLHPCGKLDDSTYELIGAAYREVATKEAWCDNVENVAEVAIISSVSVAGIPNRTDPADTGAARMLLEAQIAFDLIDTEMPIDGYKVVILPDDLVVLSELEAKLKKYVAAGGKLLISGASAIRDGKPLFDLGASYHGESEFNPDFILPVSAYRPAHMSTPFVMYTRSHRVKATGGRSLGKVYDPYFNRSYKHFCSHQHTPFRPEPSAYDCGVVSGNITYLAHPVFTLYRIFGATNYRHYVMSVLREMLGKPMVETNMPSTARITVQEQKAEKRYVAHLLYANTVARGGKMDLSGGTASTVGFSTEIVEELMPLHDVNITLRLPKAVKSAKLVPQGTPVDLKRDGDAVSFRLDQFTCHQMVELAY